MIVAGDNDDDILLAIRTVEEQQGGYAIVSGGKVIDVLPLPIAGLMSDRRYEEVTEKLSAMQKETRELGISENVDPFVTLSFMALTVIRRSVSRSAVFIYSDEQIMKEIYAGKDSNYQRRVVRPFKRAHKRARYSGGAFLCIF